MTNSKTETCNSKKDYPIERFTIKNDCPFVIKQEAKCLKKINIFFGINGVGKTQISKAFHKYNGTENGTEELQIIPKLSNGIKFLVFNRDFVEKNFSSDEIKSINKIKDYLEDPKNTEIRELIDDVEKEIKILYRKTWNWDKIIEYNEIEKVFKTKKSGFWKNYLKGRFTFFLSREIERYKEDYEKILKEYGNKKEHILEKFINFDLQDGEKKFSNRKDKLPDLLEKFNKLKKAQIFYKLENLQVQHINLLENEIKIAFNLLNEKPAKSKDNDFERFINLISDYTENENFHSWLKRGWELFNKLPWKGKILSSKFDKCLFCQKSDFIPIEKKYRNYFERLDFENKKDELNRHHHKINELIESLNELKGKIAEIREKTEGWLDGWKIKEKKMQFYEKQIKNFVNYLNNLNLKIKNKISLGSDILTEKVQESENQRSFLKQDLDLIQKNINSYLKEYRNMFGEKEKKIMELNQLFFYKTYKLKESLVKYFKKKWKKRSVNEKEIRRKIKDLKENPKYKYEKTDLSIEDINANINKFNFRFKIANKQNNNERYEIISQENNEEIGYKKISDGEKTIISFLYFLEEWKKQHLDNKKLIIVIDDPISSLVRENVLILTELLVETLRETKNKYRCQQFFILSHDFYFLNEFLHIFRQKVSFKEKKEKKWWKNLVSNFMIYQKLINGKCISILDIDEKEKLKNVYRYYWYSYNKLRREMSDEKPNICSLLLPNIMRNILEFFGQFYYYDDEKWNETRREIKELKRQMDKYSHYDLSNSDRGTETLHCKGLVQKTIDQFEKFFKSKHCEHFHEMRSIGDNS